MANYVDLHLANNIDALDLLARAPEIFSSIKKFDQICKFLDKLYKEAQQDPLNQEKTYILLLRFLHLYDKLLTVQTDQKFVDIRFGTEYRKIKTQYEEVRKSLIERYEKKAEGKASLEDIETKKPAVALAPKKSCVFSREFITCRELHSALLKNYNILIVDARPDYDYKQSRFSVPNVINVPEGCIAVGSSANVIGRKLDPETFAVWDRRDTFDVVVLLDWNTTSENFPSSKLEKLRSALVDWDLNRTYNEKPVILNGGYLELLQVYPTLCINPLVYLARKNNELDELLEIENIDYPSVSDPKAHVMGCLPVSLVKLEINEEEDETSRAVLFKENKKLAIDTQTVISKLLDAEDQWKKINDASNQEADINRVKELKNKQTQIQDEIAKLEESLEELKVKKDGIKKKFELYAKFDPEGENLKLSEYEEVFKIEEDDKAKLKILDAIADERMKALQIARALKPKGDGPSLGNNLGNQGSHQKPGTSRSPGSSLGNQGINIDNTRDPGTSRKLGNLRIPHSAGTASNTRDPGDSHTSENPGKRSKTPDSDGISPRPILKKPTINRTNKPGNTLQLAPRLVEPLGQITAGRVGLKNIRNTCYMNTVIQCFRNLPVIKHLFCDGVYSRFEIRSPAAIIYETAYLIRYLWSKVVKSIEPIEFYQKVISLEPNYALGNHEDCMEFFLFLLNHLSEDWSYDLERPTVMTPKQRAWYTQFRGKSSIFYDLFYHQIKIEQICKVCQKSSFKYETESTFMLPVPDHDFILDDLMSEYMQDFVIKECCCSTCKKPVVHRKILSYEPKIVVIVLKRYRSVGTGANMTLQKNDSKCYFKVNDFVLGSCRYKLSAIAMHSGDLMYGHYTAGCAMGDGWFDFNDEYVKPMNVNDDSVKVKACAFFYSIVEEE